MQQKKIFKSYQYLGTKIEHQSLSISVSRKFFEFFRHVVVYLRNQICYDSSSRFNTDAALRDFSLGYWLAAAKYQGNPSNRVGSK